MKVLLMVEREGRVVSDNLSQETGRYLASCSQQVIERVAGQYGMRWWLVEADSADAARNTITAADPNTHGVAEAILHRRGTGRILASGGRS